MVRDDGLYPWAELAVEHLGGSDTGLSASTPGGSHPLPAEVGLSRRSSFPLNVKVFIWMRSPFLWTLVLGVSLCVCGNGEYVIPVADGGGLEPSPPSIEGMVEKIAGGEITVRPVRAGSMSIKIGSETSIFSMYGGRVVPEEIALGQAVRVWFTLESIEKQLPTPVAAAIILDYPYPP